MAALLVVTLTEFLRLMAGERFVHGETDCAMTLANWVRAQTGTDPAKTLRGRYRTRLGWVRIVKRAGGLVTLVDGMAVGAGMTRTDEPRPGDIGVVDIPGVGQAGAIKTQNGWAMKLDDGVSVGQPVMLAAWRF